MKRKSNHNKSGVNSAVWQLFWRINKRPKDYSKSTKKELRRVLTGFIASSKKIRMIYGEKCLECDYLKRRIKQLEDD